MKVALLTREFPPEVYGGAGVHVEHLARELARHVDLAVHCFGAPRESPLVAAAYQPWSALQGNVALETMSVDLRMAGALSGVDLVHSHTWYANFGGHLASLLWGIPHVMTTHSLEPLRPWKAEQLGGGYALSSFCERVAVESAAAVIAVSQQMRADVLACYPSVDPDRVHVVHNGIDPEEYAPDRGTDALHRLGVDPSRPYAMFLGRITRQKGIAHLLEAAPLVDSAAQLVVAAGAPDTPEIATEVGLLRDRVQAERGGVVWIDSMLPRRDVVQLLTHTRAFVCPSIYEPFGLVNVEAMACEAPVVASAVGGIPEIVVDGETGFLVPCDVRPGTQELTPDAARHFAQSLAERINTLVADPDLARRMGAAGRRRAVEHFGWSTVGRRTVEVYETALRQPARTSRSSPA